MAPLRSNATSFATSFIKLIAKGTYDSIRKGSTNFHASTSLVPAFIGELQRLSKAPVTARPLADSGGSFLERLRRGDLQQAKLAADLGRTVADQIYPSVTIKERRDLAVALQRTEHVQQRRDTLDVILAEKLLDRWLQK